MNKIQIGAAIIKARQKQKKSAYKVCKEANVTSQQLHNIEEALTNYTIDSLQQVCKTVNLAISVQ